MTTIFGHTVIAYGLERTICDCLRSRNRMGIAVVTDAVKRYALRKDKNLNTLMQMAEIFGVKKMAMQVIAFVLNPRRIFGKNHPGSLSSPRA